MLALLVYFFLLRDKTNTCGTVTATPVPAKSSGTVLEQVFRTVPVLYRYTLTETHARAVTPPLSAAVRSRRRIGRSPRRRRRPAALESLENPRPESSTAGLTAQLSSSHTPHSHRGARSSATYSTCAVPFSFSSTLLLRHRTHKNSLLRNESSQHLVRRQHLGPPRPGECGGECGRQLSERLHARRRAQGR